MNSVIAQLELDQTFFVELVLITIIFFGLSHFFFKPFLALIQIRNRKTIEDRKTAERLLAQAQTKFEEYQTQLSFARAKAKADFDQAIAVAKAEESKIIARSRDEMKKISQEANESIEQQRSVIQNQVQSEIESIAGSIVTKLLSKKSPG